MWQALPFYGILLFATINRGGNRPIALLVLELLAVLLIFTLLASRTAFKWLPVSQRLFLVVLCLFPLLYLVPLPIPLWQALPGRHEYASALITAINPVPSLSLAISMDPGLTLYSWLALLPPLAVFLFLSQASTDACKQAARVFLGVATFQAVLGLIQFGAGPASILRLGWEGGGRSIGTYANRDHLAGLLEMALPIAFALLVAAIVRIKKPKSPPDSLKRQILSFWQLPLQKLLVYASLAILIFTGLIFTQSRSGVVICMLVVIVSSIVFSFKLGGKNTFGLMGLLCTIGMGVALTIGLVPVLNRFTEDPLRDARWTIFTSTWEVVKVYFPIGSGIGTYGEVYQRFHAPELSGSFINNAHNDYLEWLLEGGLVAGALIVSFILLYILHWQEVFRRGMWRTYNFVQVAAGVGMLAIMLHSLVDFNLHIPANQIYFALLAGIFFKGHIEINHKKIA